MLNGRKFKITPVAVFAPSCASNCQKTKLKHDLGKESAVLQGENTFYGVYIVLYTTASAAYWTV